MTTANRISTKLDKILHDTTTIGMIYECTPKPKEKEQPYGCPDPCAGARKR
jgi:hypothetical protein